MQWLIIENEKIIKRCCGKMAPKGATVVENFKGFVGEPITFYNPDWTRKSNIELYQQNLLPVPEGFKLEDDHLVELSEYEKALSLYNSKKIDITEFKFKVREIRSAMYPTVTQYIEAYQENVYLGLPTNEQLYKDALLYKHYLREVPQQEEFPFKPVLTFDEFLLSEEYVFTKLSISPST